MNPWAIAAAWLPVSVITGLVVGRWLRHNPPVPVQRSPRAQPFPPGRPAPEPGFTPGETDPPRPDRRGAL